jgi:YbbR domain-containing protein
MNDFYNRYKILIIAVMIAAVLWLYVNYQEGNLRDNLSFSNNQFRLEIKYENLAENFIVLDISEESVLIEPEGYRFFNTYSKEDFEAYIDLSEVQVGDNIRIVNIRTPQGVRINLKEPSYVRVTITSYKERNQETQTDQSDQD